MYSDIFTNCHILATRKSAICILVMFANSDLTELRGYIQCRKFCLKRALLTYPLPTAYDKAAQYSPHLYFILHNDTVCRSVSLWVCESLTLSFCQFVCLCVSLFNVSAPTMHTTSDLIFSVQTAEFA